MTGDEVVALVRENYGDADNNFLDTADIESWVNEALQQVYNFLPAGDMREVVNETAIALTSGRGDIPSTWDKVVSIYTTSEGELVPMPSHITNSIQAFGGNIDYFTPDVAGYSIDGNEILVTPNTISSVTAQYLVQPDEITDFTAEITSIPHRYHFVLGDWATSLAYAAEEDIEQASYYQSRAERSIASRLPGGE